MLRNIIIATTLLGSSVALSLAVAGCGGQHGTIELDVVVPPGHDPFAAAGGGTAVFAVGTESQTATLSSTGSYSISLSEKPPKTAYNLNVTVYTTMNDLVGFGETPPITLDAIDQGPFGVWVAQPGSLYASAAMLPEARTDFSAFGATGLGVVVVGGRGKDANGDPTILGDSAVWDVFTSAIISPTASLTAARAGAAAFPSAPNGAVFGGTSVPSNTEGAGGAVVDTGELFDPSTDSTGDEGTGTWTNIPVTSGMPTATSFASNVIISGSGYITGGLDLNNMPSNAVTIVTLGTSVDIEAGSPMMSQRVHHAIAACTLPDKSTGALVIGGLGSTSSATEVAEVMTGTTFQYANSTTVQGVPNLWNATATAFNGGVIVIGGSVGEGGVATNTALFINTSAATPVAPVDLIANGMLKTLAPRAGHTATMVGNDLLLCGGIDDVGNARTDCDVITGTSTATPSFSYVTQLPGLAARVHHQAVQLETGPVLFIGGDDNKGNYLASIDIYTPTMAEEMIINTNNGAVLGGSSAGD